MLSTRQRVPEHLRHHVVEQDYGAYDEIDQAVWRFTLHHTHAVLQHTAHPAYHVGTRKAGIDLERIPRLAEMDRRLADMGWGAVGVDGFIPPRAFQQLQAHSILPIAVDIRMPEHLAYTPAPDIIHEAAGHAPILADPAYGAFLRRIGEVGYRAFALPHDDLVYQAVYALSVVKERVDATTAEVQARERALGDAIDAVEGVSEAARVARLYWWTVEYGLVGTPSDYQIYGAGLLSSLGESHFCHAPSVAKLPLDARCLEVDYDITKAQPQLFVAESFAHLCDVLEGVQSGLSQARGGVVGLQTAKDSGEVATVGLASGLQISGRLTAFDQHRGRATRLCFEPGWTASERGEPLAGYARADHADKSLCLWLATRPTEPAVAGEAYMATLGDGRRASGRVRQVLRDRQGNPFAWRLDADIDSEVAQRGPQWFVVADADLMSVAAGPAHSDFFASPPELTRRAPTPKPSSPERDALLGMYARAYEAWHAQLGKECIPLFERLHARLVEAHPREWLLRWNLLESLTALGERSPLTRSLARELAALERSYGHQQPIATGLRALDPSAGDRGLF